MTLRNSIDPLNQTIKLHPAENFLSNSDKILITITTLIHIAIRFRIEINNPTVFHTYSKPQTLFARGKILLSSTYLSPIFGSADYRPGKRLSGSSFASEGVTRKTFCFPKYTNDKIQFAFPPQVRNWLLVRVLISFRLTFAASLLGLQFLLCFEWTF